MHMPCDYTAGAHPCAIREILSSAIFIASASSLVGHAGVGAAASDSSSSAAAAAVASIAASVAAAAAAVAATAVAAA